jgi:hypothetical protein
MMGRQLLEFKLAESDPEFEAIHRLNYKTFVEEIPQHTRNPQRRLVDRFHDGNTYAICLTGGRLVGMVAGRATRPFSLDSKVTELDSYLPAGHKLVEVRLLAVEKEYRPGAICCRLIGLISQHFTAQGFDMGLISGSVRQLRLYRHLGFVPFGPLVGTPDAPYQPMYVTLESFMQNAPSLWPIHQRNVSTR